MKEILLYKTFFFSNSFSQDKENGRLSNRNTLQRLQKLFASTPHRRPTRTSSLPKFETTTLFGLMNNSVSTIEPRVTAGPKRLGSLSRNLILQTKCISRKIFWSADKMSTNCDSTPEYDKVHGDSTQLATSRKSIIKKRSSVLQKKATRNKIQKEKRFAAYNKMRRMSKVERAVDETFSLTSLANCSGATYDVESQRDVTYESDILNFQAEVNQCRGPVEIVVDNFDDEIDFEKLCNVKQSDCPFEDKEKIGSALAPYLTMGNSSPKSFGEGCAQVSPQSVHSNSSTTRMSSHCARLCWNQQKIPKIETYKAEKKSFDNDSRHSSRSNHSTQPLFTTIKSIHANVTVGWQDLPSFVQYYIVAITICFISILNYQFNH